MKVYVVPSYLTEEELAALYCLICSDGRIISKGLLSRSIANIMLQILWKTVPIATSFGFDKVTMACLGSIEADTPKMKSEEEINHEIDKFISIAMVLMDKRYGKNELNPLRSHN